MMGKNINFKLVSLNVRGICSFEKQKAMLNWLLNLGPIYVFHKRPTALEKLLTYGKNNGRAIAFSHMAVVTVKAQRFLLRNN